MLNSAHACSIAKKKTPSIAAVVRDDWSRYDLSMLLVGSDNVGIELGTASGGFAKKMIASGKFDIFFGVDSYPNNSDDAQYHEAINTLGVLNKTFSLIRSDFECSLDLFEDETFDFIYVDGYAHTGEEGGKTLFEWYSKLKVGGVMCGDDYHSDWPLVVWAVNDFVAKLGVNLHVVSKTHDLDYCRYPSWYFIKKSNEINFRLNEDLVALAKKEALRIAFYRTFRKNNPRVLLGRLTNFLGLSQFQSFIKNLRG